MSMPSDPEKQRFLDTFAREHATTMRVVRAYPADRLDLKAAERSTSARDLLWLFNGEQGLMERALTTGFDWSAPRSPRPSAPNDLAAIADAIEQSYQRVVALVRERSGAELDETVQWPVAPKQMGEVKKLDFLWFMLLDQIHHRGQLSVYLRIAGAKVPSIYGPSGDEPWL